MNKHIDEIMEWNKFLNDAEVQADILDEFMRKRDGDFIGWLEDKKDIKASDYRDLVSQWFRDDKDARESFEGWREARFDEHMEVIENGGLEWEPEDGDDTGDVQPDEDTLPGRDR